MDRIENDILHLLVDLQNATPDDYLTTSYLVKAGTKTADIVCGHCNEISKIYRNKLLIDTEKLQNIIKILRARRLADDYLAKLELLSSDNYVRFVYNPSYKKLTLSCSKLMNQSIKVAKQKEIELVYFRRVEFPRTNTPVNYTVLPYITTLIYKCECYEDCKCTRLRLPLTTDGESFLIFRNHNGAFEIKSKKEYEDYVRFPPKFTFDPEMIIRTQTGLDINYKKYYQKYVTKYQHIKFRIEIQNPGIITKSGIGIPLIAEVTDDLKFITNYVYRFTHFRDLESDMHYIMSVLPAGSKLMFEAVV